MLDLSDIIAARDRVAEVARRTPLDRSHMFSKMTGADLHLKFETHQRTGSFKIRGAANRIATLSASERTAGVVTASAGNHAQGVALAASRAGVDATIVMPEFAPVSKVKATEYYGGDVVLHGIDYAEAAEHAHELVTSDGYTYVHAFDDEQVMAGQGTVGLEIVEELPSVETVVVPIGGGGLISGVATAVCGKHPDARIVGVQAEGASSAADSLAKGEIQTLDQVDTIADGIATRRVGELPFDIIQERVDEIVTVSDADIAVAVLYALERSKTLLEGAGAVSLAAVLHEAFEYEPGETIVPVLSGGNIDINVLTTVLMRGLVHTGRYLKIRTVLADRPGALNDLATILGNHRVNIYAVEHDRTSRDIALDDAEIELDLETRGPEHVETVLDALESNGYEVELLV